MVVDDEEINRIILNAIFENQYKVLQAENGKQALEVLEECNYEVDVIFLDMAMPVMDGIGFLEERQKNIKMEDIPVIIITADDTSAQQVKAIALGASDYIIKPFVGETVLRRTRNVLESKRNLEKYIQAAKESMKKV